MKKYTVERIIEADFVCEGVPDNAETMVTIFLRDKDGDITKITHSDKLLYQKEIDEGDTVTFIENELTKIN